MEYEVRGLIMRGVKTVAKGLALLWLAVAAPLSAQVQDTAPYMAATQALVDTISKANAAPAATDPVLLRATREAETLRAVIGTPKLPITELSTMNSLCVPALNVMLAYFDIGLDARLKAAPVDTDRQALKNQVETENAARYFDPALPFMLLNVRCNASHMPVIEKFMASIPAGQMTSTQLQGVSQIRGGARDQIQGLITAAADPAAGEARRLRLLGELARDIDLMLMPLTTADKAGIAQEVQAMRPSLSVAGKAQADTITAALKASGCGRLCSVVIPAN
jgi:hypothetical protein